MTIKRIELKPGKTFKKKGTYPVDSLKPLLVFNNILNLVADFARTNRLEEFLDCLLV
jgi:hypothetical protein